MLRNRRITAGNTVTDQRPSLHTDTIREQSRPALPAGVFGAESGSTGKRASQVTLDRGEDP